MVKAPPGQRDRRLLITCGFQSSGNKMLVRCFNVLGVDGWTVHGTPVLKPEHPHYSRSERRGAHVVERIHRPGMTYAVMPIRHFTYRKQSHATYPVHDTWMVWPYDELNQNLLRVISRCRIPFRAVSYEAFVESPEDHMKYFAEWMGVPWDSAWKFNFVFDANDKWRKAR